MNIWDLLDYFSCPEEVMTSGDYMTCLDCSEQGCEFLNCPIFEEYKEFYEDIVNE